MCVVCLWNDTLRNQTRNAKVTVNAIVSIVLPVSYGWLIIS